MSEYKSPRSRMAVKNMVRKVLINWIDENLDDTGDTNTVWDDADDAAARTYRDNIEEERSYATDPFVPCGNLIHTAAMKEAKERFWEELRTGLESQIAGVFERLGK